VSLGHQASSPGMAMKLLQCVLVNYFHGQVNNYKSKQSLRLAYWLSPASPLRLLLSTQFNSIERRELSDVSIPQHFSLVISGTG
jgi:hypothetical protein